MHRSIAYFGQLRAKNYKYTQHELIQHIRALQRRRNGLTVTERTIMFNFLTKSKASYPNFRLVLNSVLPDSTVQEHEVKLLLIWFFMNINTSKRKCSAILTWISVMLHFNLCDKKAVKKFYSQFIIAFKVGYQVPHVCKIIYDLTNPDDIYRMMVQDFIAYFKKYPKFKPVGAVLSRFKHYRPDLVPEQVPSVSPKTAFQFMFPQDLLYNINDILGKDITDLIPDGKQYHKKRIVDVIPPMLYLHFKNTRYKRSAKYRLYDFDNAHHLAMNQSSIELPHNIISLIADDRGHLVLSGENITVQARLSIELEQILCNVFITDGHMYYPEDKKKLLDAVVCFLEFMQRPVPVVSTFLIKYIQIWDGKHYEEGILQLLPWLSFITNRGYIQNFQPALKSLFVTIPVEKKCRIVSAMGRFLINYITRSKPQLCTIFGGSVENFLPEEVVSNVASFILDLSANEMMYENDQCLLHASMDFFELVCIISEILDVPLQIHLPAAIAYRALFSKEATSLTRLCSIFLRLPKLYKESESVITKNSISYMLKLFKDFFECLTAREEQLGNNFILENNSQQTVFIRNLILEERFANFAKHLAFSLISLVCDEEILDDSATARTTRRECKSVTDFLLYYEKTYVRRKRSRQSSK